MSNSIYADWQDEKWEFPVRDLLSEKTQEDDSGAGIPMMNYAYPLEHFTFDNKVALEVHKQTNCTIVYDTETEEYFLALSGGGMDLSQDIAKAYMLIQTFIPWEWIDDIYISSALSVSRFWYRKILKQIKSQLITRISNSQDKISKIEECLNDKEEK
jgi:hypothetical protein